MKMQKKQFRIGKLAKKLDVERFIIRFWEKEFNLKSHRSDGGQRFYEERDYHTFQQIKDLLYKKRFTIHGARQQLQQTRGGADILGSHQTIINKNESPIIQSHLQLLERINNLNNKLKKLRSLL